MKKKFQLVILAAGHGKRMGNNNFSKVLLPFKEKPIIKHLLEAVSQTKLFPKPVIVVGQKANQVKKTLGQHYLYVYQKEQLGTGHAVLCCRKLLENKYLNILVLYGDHPLLTAKSIIKIVRTHLKSSSTLTMATVEVGDFNDWRKTFSQWGRIIRDKNKHLKEIVEVKDADEKQQQIREVNPSFFCFDAYWLWKNLTMIKNNNAAKEYYLTDLLKLAVDQKEKIKTVEIGPQEAYGVNTIEQLQEAKTFT